MRRLLAPALLLGGCIVTEEVPAGVFSDAVQFDLRCAERGYEAAVGCVLACGATASPVLGVGSELREFVGAGATYEIATVDDTPFDPRCGTAQYRTCVANAFGGLVCTQQSRRYCATCTADGVAIGDDRGRTDGAPLLPASLIGRSALPSMLAGTLRGEAGSCLAGCIAQITRPACDACGEHEGCLETGFGQVCHPRGPLGVGESCRGPQDCASLGCDVEGGRCE